MNWEYRLVPSTTSELDSATFSGIKFFKTLRDENNNEIANFETTALDFTENASQSVKDSYLPLCREIFGLHMANSLTPDAEGKLNYQLDHAFGAMLYEVRSIYKVIIGDVN